MRQQTNNARRRRAWGRVGLVALCALGSNGQADAAQATGSASANPDPWEPFRQLVGTWSAGIDGALGQGEGSRTYEFFVQDVYLVHRHASLRRPQPASPEGDYHRELAVYSFDRTRGVIVLREFMEEGYVLQSTCETEPQRFVCTTEAVESGPELTARLTIEIESRFRFTEIFELAGAGEALTVLFNNTWTRVPEVPDSD